MRSSPSMFLLYLSCLKYTSAGLWLDDGLGWFSIKMTSYQCRKSHCGDKTILRPSYLYNGTSYTDKMTSLYWIKAQDPNMCGTFLKHRRCQSGMYYNAIWPQFYATWAVRRTRLVFAWHCSCRFYLQWVIIGGCYHLWLWLASNNVDRYLQRRMALPAPLLLTWIR